MGSSSSSAQPPATRVPADFEGSPSPLVSPSPAAGRTGRQSSPAASPRVEGGRRSSGGGPRDDDPSSGTTVLSSSEDSGKDAQQVKCLQNGKASSKHLEKAKENGLEENLPKTGVEEKSSTGKVPKLPPSQTDEAAKQEEQHAPSPTPTASVDEENQNLCTVIPLRRRRRHHHFRPAPPEPSPGAPAFVVGLQDAELSVGEPAAICGKSSSRRRPRRPSEPAASGSIATNNDGNEAPGVGMRNGGKSTMLSQLESFDEDRGRRGTTWNRGSLFAASAGMYRRNYCSIYSLFIEKM